MSYDPTKPFKRNILKSIRETWDTEYVEVKDEGGPYPVIHRKFNKPEIDHTDGIGTKGVHHWRNHSYHFAVHDAMAMNLNDIAMMGAVPYKLQNHIIIPKESNEAIERIVYSLVEECKKRRIAITGGETSIQNNMVGMDISITMSAFLDDDVKPNKFKEGDCLVGFKSNGLHSNGFTLATEVLPDNKLEYFTMPTKIYYDMIMPIINIYDVRGMMHIAGGAFTRLKDLLDERTSVKIAIGDKIPEVFREINDLGIDDNIMYRTFNCGIGFILGTDFDSANKIVAKHRGEAEIIGTVISGIGRVNIISSFSRANVIL
jgi:phosphoribosylformylglycinamidine cyclo-ligase